MTVLTSTTPSRTKPHVAYSLTFTDGVPSDCTCPGYGYRGTCRHITEHTDGGYEVYCYGCMTTHLRAVRYDAGRAWVRGHNNACTYCGRRRTLCVVQDWDARGATSARDDLAIEVLQVPGGARDGSRARSLDLMEPRPAVQPPTCPGGDVSFPRGDKPVTAERRNNMKVNEEMDMEYRDPMEEPGMSCCPDCGLYRIAPGQFHLCNERAD